MALTIYQYPNCSTCKQALAWLDRHGIAATSIDIVAHPPSRVVLARAQVLAGVTVAKLFNVSGQSYRAGNFKSKLATMTDAAALDALASDGKLIKRPLLIGSDIALIGFVAAAWQRALT